MAFRRTFSGFRLEHMAEPGDLVSRKASREVPVLRGTDRVSDAVKAICDGWRTLPVLGEKDEFLGMVSAVDVLDYLGAGPKAAKARKLSRPLDARVTGIMESDVRQIDSKSRVVKAFEVFREHGRRMHPVTTKGRYVAMLSETELVSGLGKTKARVKDIMTPRPIVCHRQRSVKEAAEMLVRGGFRQLPVVDRNVILGMLTAEGLVSYLNEKGKLASLNRCAEPASSAMSSHLSVEPEARVDEALEMMGSRDSLLVAEEDELMGILTRRDVLDFTL